VTSDDREAAGGSRLTVALALLANAGVGVLKLIAGLVSGSAALLSEAAHSAGDTSTELLLFTALRRSDRPADRVHPFGYGKERYFWSLLAAVAIFVSGAAFSVYQGVHTIVEPDKAHHLLWINYPVLILAFVLEGLSLRQAVRQTRGEARQRRRPLGDVVRDPHDPTVRSVVLEDSAALIGVTTAALGVALHQITGSAFWDGLASLLIGALLVVAAVLLARTCQALLIGKQADAGLMRQIEARIEEQDEVDDVVDLLTMMVGVDRILLCARVDFVDCFSAGELEQACVRMDSLLRREFPALGEVFIQPASKTDRHVQQRVRERYGHELADRPAFDPGPRRASSRQGAPKTT
jgi:cation diffusion facilitator family transporter